jgi:pimeloyl-ACP methyl ester carboxylesterase
MNWREYQALQKVSEFDSRFMSFVEQGEGPPVVLLHGIPTWGYLWHPIIPRLARSHRVLVPDLLGFGYSDKSDRFDRSIRYQAETIARWMEAMNIEGAAVIGHDIGGGVALRLAVLFPRLLSRLCLINSVCYDSWPIEMMLQLGLPEMNRKANAAAITGTMRHTFKKMSSTSLDDEILDGLVAPYSTETGKLSLIRDAAALNTNLTVELDSFLSRINVPTLILWGEDDEYQPVKYGERLAWDIPNSRMVRLKGAGHFAMLDQQDEVEKQVLSFLEG